MKQYYNSGFESRLSYEDRVRMRENSIRTARELIARYTFALAEARDRLAALESEPVEEDA